VALGVEPREPDIFLEVMRLPASPGPAIIIQVMGQQR